MAHLQAFTKRIRLSSLTAPSKLKSIRTARCYRALSHISPSKSFIINPSSESSLEHAMNLKSPSKSYINHQRMKYSTKQTSAGIIFVSIE